MYILYLIDEKKGNIRENKNKVNRKHKLVHTTVFCDSKHK